MQSFAVLLFHIMQSALALREKAQSPKLRPKRVAPMSRLDSSNCFKCPLIRMLKLEKTYLEIVSARPYFLSFGAIWNSTHVRSISCDFGRQGLVDAFSVAVEIVLRTETCTAAFTSGPVTYVGFVVAEHVFSLWGGKFG